MNTVDNSAAVGRTLIAAAVASELLEGHTDSVGSDDCNLGLSQRRAHSVRSYVVSQGVDAARITATGPARALRSPAMDRLQVASRAVESRSSSAIRRSPRCNCLAGSRSMSGQCKKLEYVSRSAA